MCRMPISEGVVDKRYSMVGPMLIKDALRRQPMLYGLGIGNLEVVVARIVLSMGWRVIRVVPFFFKVRNGFQFLRNIQYLRTTRLRQWLLDAAAYSGLGWAGTRIADAVLTRNGHRAVTVEQVGEFSAWADGVWQTCPRSTAVVISVHTGDAVSRILAASWKPEGMYLRGMSRQEIATRS